MIRRLALAFTFAFNLGSALLLSTNLALAQPVNRPPNPEDQAAAAAACTTCCGGTAVVIVLAIAIPIVILVINLALLIWVARDAKSRNMDSAVMWMMLVMFTGPIGLVIYIFSRPQGELMRCDECGNTRLQASRKCPHCGNA